MDETTRLERARIFGASAEDYDAVRPGYPDELFEQTFSFGDLRLGARVLEIGCGTGQATRSIAPRGVDVVCLEPATELAELARANFAKQSNVSILETAFDEFSAEEGSFDLVMAATSFHWLDPATRLTRCAQFLRDRGSIAIASSSHPPPYTGFFEEVQRCYDAHVPEWAQRRRASANDGSKTDGFVAELEHSPEFGDVTLWSMDWTYKLTSQAYARLLRTFSDHRRLGTERLEALITDIRSLIDERYGGVVHRPYRFVLRLARRLPRCN